MQHLKLIRSAYLFKYPQFRLSRVMGCFVKMGSLFGLLAILTSTSSHIVQVGPDRDYAHSYGQSQKVDVCFDVDLLARPGGINPKCK